MTSPTERSIPELFGDAMAQLAKLVGNEFALARAEMSEKAEQVGRAMISMTSLARQSVLSPNKSGVIFRSRDSACKDCFRGPLEFPVRNSDFEIE